MLALENLHAKIMKTVHDVNTLKVLVESETIVSSVLGGQRVVQHRSLPHHTAEYWPAIFPRVERLDSRFESHLVSTLLLDQLIEVSCQRSRVKSADSLDNDQRHLATKDANSHQSSHGDDVDAIDDLAHSKETGQLDGVSVSRNEDTDDDDDDAKEDQHLRDILVPYLDRFLSSQVRCSACDERVSDHLHS
jgi:hypothetical protein